MNKLYSNIYKSFIITSVIAFLIGIFSSGQLSTDSYIAGYSVLSLAIFMIIFILTSNVLSIQGQSTSKILQSIVSMMGPFILMLGIIGFILYILITYRSIIVDNHVSQSYHSFSNIVVILLLMQLYIIYTNITSQEFETTKKLSSVTSSIIYLLTILTGISSIIIFTILKYFTTDGFIGNIN